MFARYFTIIRNNALGRVTFPWDLSVCGLYTFSISWRVSCVVNRRGPRTAVSWRKLGVSWPQAAGDRRSGRTACRQSIFSQAATSVATHVDGFDRWLPNFTTDRDENIKERSMFPSFRIANLFIWCSPWWEMFCIGIESQLSGSYNKIQCGSFCHPYSVRRTCLIRFIINYTIRKWIVNWRSSSYWELIYNTRWKVHSY